MALNYLSRKIRQDSSCIFVGKEYICNNMEYIVFAPSLIYEDVWE